MGLSLSPRMPISMFGVACNTNHCRSQQPILQLVALLQLIDDLMIWLGGRVHHFDGLMPMGIEWLALGRNGAQAKFAQRVLQLLVDEFHPIAQLRLVSRTGLQRTFETVE